MFRKRTIFTKLFYTYLVSIFASFLVFVVIFSLLFENDLKEQFEDTLFKSIDQVNDVLNLAHENRWSEETISSTLDILHDPEHHNSYLFNKNGEVIYSNTGDDDLAFLAVEFAEDALNGKTISKPIELNEQRMFIVAAPLEESSEYQLAEAVVFIHYGYEGMIMGIKMILLLAGVVSIVITGGLLYFLSKGFTAPLTDMNQIALEYAKGNFSKRVKTVTDDEIGQLGETFNYMAKELASLDLMRKEFVANVSHDLRSPLTSLNGFVSAMLDGTIKQDKQKHYLHLMKDETERLIKLVNDLLDIARIESGQVVVHPTNYNVSEQLRTLVATMEPELVKNEVELTLVSEVDEDIFVFADQDRMDQVFGNLIQNAVNFSPRKGQITIRIWIHNQQVKISIQDFGPGIEHEELQNIWNRFFKVDRARSKKVGTGIGLSIVKHIIELHNAKIDVRSTIGQGTTFIVTLPIENTSKKEEG